MESIELRSFLRHPRSTDRRLHSFGRGQRTLFEIPPQCKLQVDRRDRHSADRAGLPRPAHLQGQSLVSLLDDPQAAGKEAAFQVYPRRTMQTGPLLGHAVRTDRWRYVEWRKADESVAARELYDLQDDPDETVNLAAKAKHATVVAEQALTWRKALPAVAE